MQLCGTMRSILLFHCWASAAALSTNKAKMSDRKEKKHKKKKHKKDKKPRLHERVGYTDDDHPFGDRDLGATFVWKKKEDQSRKKKRPPPSRDEEDRIEEIEKVRRRRDAREAELAEMERLRDEERRLRDAEQFEDWQAKEEDSGVSLGQA